MSNSDQELLFKSRSVLHTEVTKRVLAMTLPKFSHLLPKILRHLPLLAVIAVALIIAFQNIDPKTYFSGWDNILAELNLGRYVQQIIGGAWITHQGPGAPAAQGQLAELPRLPILWVMSLILPPNLIRYVFIFAMYLIGGVGTYFYLSTVWLKAKTGKLKNWIASVGGIFYLLHILTLQQFYISFEMFTIQFAFLPFLLLVIHRFTSKITAKTLLLFLLVQLLIAPSAHTPTCFYLAALFSVMYAFFLLVPKGIVRAIRVSFLIGLLTFFFNAYWLVPNLYYAVHDGRYVQQSWDNVLFGPESVWSVREAGNIPNLLSGKQYLFSWKDYSFATHQFEYILNDWTTHLAQPQVMILLELLGLITIIGAVFTAFDRQKGPKRWAILLMYGFCLAFIWIDMFPTRLILDKLYQSGSFLEAFRDTFTKLSIIYGFLSILLFASSLEVLSVRLANWPKLAKFSRPLTGLMLAATTLAIIYTARPSFQGHFLNAHLKVIYPTQYAEMFSYLKTRSANLRVLEFPQLSHAGWDYYDWSFVKLGNGYQGMGFYFFGIPQPVMDRDSDRWVETSDYFYQELKYALETKNVLQLQAIFAKYQLNLFIVDESKIDPSTQNHSYASDHQLLQMAGLKAVWHKDFLTIYERPTAQTAAQILTPVTTIAVNADTTRVKSDVAYQQFGDYLEATGSAVQVSFPFANLNGKILNQATLTDTAATVVTSITPGEYQLSLPSLVDPKTATYFSPVAIEYQNQTVTLHFPHFQIQTGSNVTNLPSLSDVQFPIKLKSSSLIVNINHYAIFVDQGQTVSANLAFLTQQPNSIQYAANPGKLILNAQGEISAKNLNFMSAPAYIPNWSALMSPVQFSTGSVSDLRVTTQFPVQNLNLQQNPPINCASPLLGNIHTESSTYNVLYKANNFGVNCGGYSFDLATPTTAYILQISGQNFQGRSIKYFVNYFDPKNHEILPDDYVFQQPKYTANIPLLPVSQNIQATFALNWETRSFGKESVNELDGMKLAVFPLEQVAHLQLSQLAQPTAKLNPISVTNDTQILNFLHFVHYDCQVGSCYLGLNQSHDDLWVAVKLGSLKPLPHFRLNNWANLWQVSGNGVVLICYLPELFALIAAGLIPISLVILVILAKRQQYELPQKLPKILKKVRKTFDGKKMVVGKERVRHTG